MKKLLLLLFAAVSIAATASAQNYFTRDGKVKFDASTNTSLETVEALSNTASCVVDAASGKMEWAVLLKSFHFEKALMEEHFNENYVESSKYPKATFTGTITNLNEVTLSKDGVYHATVTGQFTLHGVTKDMTTYGVITVSGGNLKVNAGFTLTLADFNITVPSMVSDKVSKEAKILVDATLAPMK